MFFALIRVCRAAPFNSTLLVVIKAYMSCEEKLTAQGRPKATHGALARHDGGPHMKHNVAAYLPTLPGLETGVVV